MIDWEARPLILVQVPKRKFGSGQETPVKQFDSVGDIGQAGRQTTGLRLFALVFVI